MTALAKEFTRLNEENKLLRLAGEAMRDALIPFLYVTGGKTVAWNPTQEAAVERVREALDVLECALDPTLEQETADAAPTGGRKANGEVEDRG